MIMGIIMLLMVLLSIFYIVKAPDQESFPAKIYFLNPATNELEYEIRNIAYQEGRLMVSDVYNEMLKGPESKHLVTTFPADITDDVRANIVVPVDNYTFDFNMKNNKIELAFPNAYRDLSTADEILFRASLVYTLTELPFVSGVEIFVLNGENKEVIQKADGTPLGMLNRDNLRVTPNITSEIVTIKRVELFFPNKELTGLVKEYRNIQIHLSSQTSTEKAILEEIIKGPKTDGLITLFPADVVISDIKLESKICYVDFASPIDTKTQTDTAKQELLLYSIVNSLILNDTVTEKVQILINGERADFSSKPYEKNEDIIIKNIIEMGSTGE